MNETVLIIDDSSERIDFLAEKIFKPDGYRVITAQNTETGLKLTANALPDLILLPLDWVAVDGPVLRAAAPSAALIATAPQESAVVTAQAFQLGLRGVLLPTFEPARVRASVEGALAETRLRAERDSLARRLETAGQELAQRARELTTLFGVGKSVTALLDQERLLSRLVEAAIYLTNAEEGSLLLVDRATDELYMVAARGIDERVARSFRLRVQDSLAGQVMASGQPVILSSQDITKIKTSYLVRSLMYVPLKVRERVIGVFTVDNRYEDGDFEAHHLRLLSALADYAAISLDNARWFNRAETEQHKLSTILAELTEPVVVLSETQRVVVANLAFKRLFGLEIDPVAGSPLEELVTHAALLAFVKQAAQNATRQRDEVLLDDGRAFTVTLSPVPGVGHALVMQDISHLKALERMKSEFVATVSHDLRSPLASIKDYVAMLRQVQPLTQKQTMFVDRIGGVADHVSGLVDRLLDLSAIELNEDPNITTVDFGKLTANIVMELQEPARRTHHQLVFHPPGRPAPVRGNPRRLRQLVGHLVENALKYTPSSGQISALVQVDGSHVMFKIEDGGPGIPPADLPFVFDKFFRVKSTNHAGAGLGLSICKSIVEKYQGHIWAESQPGQGTVFCVRLPLAAPD